MSEPRICPVCGKPLPDIRGGRKAHEGFCTKVRRASYMREYMREYYRRNKRPSEDPAPKPKPVPRSGPKPVPRSVPEPVLPLPEDPPPRRLTIDELAAKARSEGKTYGQLRAEMLLEKMRREKRRRLEETVSCLKAEITLDELIRISRLEGEALRKWLVEMIRKQEERAE